MITFRQFYAGAFALAACAPARAVLGVYEHGNGIVSMGMGGVSYSYAAETTALSANPAHALALGDRYDIGVDLFGASAEATIHDNALGPDQSEKSDGKTYYMIPQGGWSKRISPDVGLGVTVLSAGLGPDYAGSPYARFGGQPNRARLDFASSSVVTALAFRVWERHVIGVSLNTGYQTLALEGLQFLDNPALSSSPGHVTNQGKDGAFTIGATVGWYADLAPWLSAGASYRTKNRSQNHREYRGLVAGGGKLDLPAIYGGGFTFTPVRGVKVALEAQRYNFRDEKAFRNGVGQFEEGYRLGDRNGPGFGFDDQNAYKLGVSWDATPSLTLRAGYTYGTQMVNEENTLFAFLGCLTTQSQYSLGATYRWGQWEMTGYAYDDPKKKVHGKGSIPDAFGGGEADISDLAYGIGFSLGHRFGR